MSQFSNSTIFPQLVQIRWSWWPLCDTLSYWVCAPK